MTELSDTARAYHNLGVPVIPFMITKTDNGVFDKKPVVNAWKKWEDDIQTDEEFEALDWNQVNAFGVVLGGKAANGFFLTAIDHDFKGLSDDIREKGKEILKEFPTTQREETVNKGTHLIYWSRQKVKTDATFHDTAGLELLGEKKICVMAPSEGYRKVNDNMPTEIENLEILFNDVMKRHGFSHTEETEVESQLDSYSFQLSKVIDLTQLKQVGTFEFQGPHPLHDSTTEKNFMVNVKSNIWHCFRHDSGGGALQYLAMKEGIIKCEQAKRGALRGRKFRQVLALAASQGLIDSKVLEQAEINPIILAKDIMEDYIFIVDADTNTLYFYDENKGFYSDKTETLIKREIAKRLDENFRTRYFTEINEFILATAPLVTVNAQQPEILAVSNGLLNVFTKELKKPSPEQCVTSRLDVEYLPERACPEWLKFLEQVIPNSVQRLQVQELIGHCLVRKVLTETVLVLLGTGANGKSICLDVVKTLLGESNVSSHSIQKLCFDKFTTIEIRNKLANICADLPQKELIGTGIFKALVSGDMVQGYTKHVQKTVPFMPTCKYLFSANNTPPVATEEDCYAWYRRFVFADFTRTFTKKDSVPRQELLAKMTTPEELSGILNWALEGLARLKQNGEISERPTVEAIRLEYIRRSDSALAYFEHSVTITDDPSDYVLTDVWFRDYVTYCHYHHLRAKTQGEFTKSVKQHLPGAEKTRMRDDPESNPISAWRYVKFVPTVLDVSASKKRLFKTEKSLSEFPIQSNKVSEVDTTNTPDTESQYAEGEGHI